MIFDMRDFEVLRLCGLCRYLPIRLRRRFNLEIFDVKVINTLRKHGLIKLQSDGSGYKLTYNGRQVLSEMGYTFPEDARTNIKRSPYKRKLFAALWNIVLYLAGIDIWGKDLRTLNGKDTGYISSLMMRSDNNKKVLAGARFLGVLKIFNTVYVPYFLANGNEKIQPAFERNTYTALADSLSGVRGIKLILTGKSLEELWAYINLPLQGVPPNNGQRCFYDALEELGNDYLLMPLNNHGALQMGVIKFWRDMGRFSQMLGSVTLKEEAALHLSDCDGMIEDQPCVLAFDFNVKRIVRALNQVKKYDAKLVPRIYCFPFQKRTMFMLLKKYGIIKSMVYAVEEESVRRVFPEVNIKYSGISPYISKEGVMIDASDGKISKNDVEVSEDTWDMPKD